MDIRHDKVETASEALLTILDNELAEVVQEITKSYGDLNNPFTIELPETYAVDWPLEDLASLVARTANKYGRAARAAGIARAQAKLATGRFNGKYKRSRIGKNDSERDANAMEACKDEHAAMTLAETIAEVIEGIEAGARVASESARKVFGAAENQQRANVRQESGQFRGRDFQ